jgi:RNA polymerase sigma-70 factor (ECF subfamily)
MNDGEEWVARARAGDHGAFRRIVEAQSRPLFAVCMRITRDAALAEDAVQEAFLKAWRHLADFDGRSALRTWLHRIAVNAALEQLRRRGRDGAVADIGDDTTDFLAAIEGDVPDPHRHALGDEVRRRTEEQLARMSATERTAFVLRHHEGQSLEDIAGVLAINTNACKQAIFRAVRKLRIALHPLRSSA